LNVCKAQFFEKLTTKPIMIKQESKNEPPAEINGIGRPLTGIKPIVIAELINICERSIEANPTITKLEK
jgi:hypothetical protein